MACSQDLGQEWQGLTRKLVVSTVLKALEITEESPGQLGENGLKFACGYEMRECTI